MALYKVGVKFLDEHRVLVKNKVYISQDCVDEKDKILEEGFKEILGFLDEYQKGKEETLEEIKSIRKEIS